MRSVDASLLHRARPAHASVQPPVRPPLPQQVQPPPLRVTAAGARVVLGAAILSGFLALTTPFWGLLLALAVVFLAFLELSHPRPRRRARAALAVAGTSAVVAGAALLVGFAELATIVPGAPDGTVLEVRIEERLDRVDLHEASLAGDERRTP